MKIDWWTLGLQTVNVLVLIWLLRRFFWRPIASMIEQRRAAAAGTLTEAAAKLEAAKMSLADIDKTRAGFAAERDAILATAQEQAEHARAVSLDQARAETASLEAAANAAIAMQAADVETRAQARAGRLAVDIAEHLATRLEGPAVRAAFLDWLVTSIRAMPAEARQATSAGGVVLEATTATPLDPSEQMEARSRIDDALGHRSVLVFKADPSLIAGLELHGPHFAVTNSWRADLARILTDLHA
jgi:F-type H+-transporting ATPase subunit b